MSIFQKIAEVLYNGETFSHGDCSILINDSDNIELWTPKGGKEASLINFDAAVKAFIEASKIAEEEGSDGDSEEDSEGDSEKVKQDLPDDSLRNETKDIIKNELMETEFAAIGDGTNPLPEFDRMASEDSEEDSEKGSDTKIKQEPKDIIKNELMEKQFEAIGDGTNPMPEYNKMGKIVDTFSKVDPWEDYRRLRSQSFSQELLRDIGDPDKWESRMAGEPVFKDEWEDTLKDMKDHGNVEKDSECGEKHSNRVAGPRIKENWGDYSRDLEAESAQDLYHLVRSLGQEDPYDWQQMAEQLMPNDSEAPGMGMVPNPMDNPGMAPGMNPGTNPGMDPNAPTQQPVIAIDEAGKKYYEDYYGQYGKDLTKGDVTKDRLKKKDVKKDVKKESQQMAPAPGGPKAPGMAPGAPGGAPGQQAPKGPGMAPGAPGQQAPGQQAPGGAQVPQKQPTEKLDPGEGSQGLEALGWTNEDIQLMDEGDKSKILQHKINKPGTKPSGPPIGGAPGQQAPKGPGMAPGAPEQAPPQGPGGMAPPQARSLAKAIQAKIAFLKVQQQLQQPMQQPAPEFSQQPAPQPGVENEFAGSDGEIDARALDIFEEVKNTPVSAADASMIPLEKMQMLGQRLGTELGMTVDEFISRLGINKQQLQNLFE